MSGQVVDDVAGPLRVAVDGLLEAEFETHAPQELAGLLSELQRQRSRLEAVEAQVIAALSGQATAAQFGATSVLDLVGGLTRTARGEARARAQRAVDLAERRTLSGEPLPPIHPLTAAALRVGEISGGARGRDHPLPRAAACEHHRGAVRGGGGLPGRRRAA